MSEDDLARCIGRWREAASRRDAAARLLADHGDCKQYKAEAAVFRHCAYQLEALTKGDDADKGSGEA